MSQSSHVPPKKPLNTSSPLRKPEVKTPSPLVGSHLRSVGGEKTTPQYPHTPKTPTPEPKEDLRPRITVVGVGGAGSNAVNNMIRSSLQGVRFVVSNTDAQALEQSLTEHRIQLGAQITQGLGAGSKPEVGRAAAEESLQDIYDQIQGSNMVFITAGMGGGTGTGAAPVVAQVARELGVLTVAVATKPFHFEGHHRMRTAEKGLEELTQYVDTLIVIPNQNLFRIANEKTSFVDAFRMADDVLHSGVRGVTDLMMMPGLINLDFADIRSVMSEMGKAMMGTGEASDEGRAIAAAEAAISNPLLDDVSMKGAQGVLINITGGMDMTLFEVDEAANRIREEVDANANIIFGSTFDEKLKGVMRVSVVATGIESEKAREALKKTHDATDAPQDDSFAEDMYAQETENPLEEKHDIGSEDAPYPQEPFIAQEPEKKVKVGFFRRIARSFGGGKDHDDSFQKSLEEAPFEESPKSFSGAEDYDQVPAYVRRRHKNKDR